MSPLESVPFQARYWITLEGRAAASAEDTCKCALTNQDGWLICIYCRTGFKIPRPQAARTSEKPL